MNKKISLGSAISFMAIAVAVTFTATMLFSMFIFNNRIANVNTKQQIYNKISEIDNLVRQNLKGKIDDTKLNDALSAGFLNGIGDDYARYYSSEEYDKEQRLNDGKLVGIGVLGAADESGYIKIEKVYKESPAMTVGLKKDDLIISIDGVDVSTMGVDAAFEALKGDLGTTLKLGYRRDAVDNVVEITRKKYEITSVEYSIVNNFGYIKIFSFTTATVSQFKEAIEAVSSKKVKGLIFDLRNNPGGTLDSVCQILDVLLPEGEIGTSIDNKGIKKVLYKSNANEIKLPMVTIGNGGTASAAELFISCLRDYNKAKLVGTKTFGKGVGQSTFQLVDGSAISLTTFEYSTPKTPNFNKIGLTPDFQVTLTKEQEKSLVIGDEKTDFQFKKALEVLSANKK